MLYSSVTGIIVLRGKDFGMSRMNKKQIVVLWTFVIIISLLLGLETTTVYRLSEFTKPGGPETGSTALMLYGSLLISSDTSGKLHFLLPLGNYKYHLMIVVALISGTLIYTFRYNARDTSQHISEPDSGESPASG